MHIALLIFVTNIVNMVGRDKPNWHLKIAKERIERLFQLAEENSKTNPNYSKRYVTLARRICMRYNIRLPKEWRRKICKGCNCFFVHGVNCTVRANKMQQAVNIFCKTCGHVTRYPYIREKKIRNS